ncbi:hypothetical protein ACIQCF_07320 [Streptomyces sp. NPDC088353]|uniref:hypothetical protein n=1 Tax=Streptomyces sp. NPDC088353 TaxID=3365855 RepID=UPI0037F13281
MPHRYTCPGCNAAGAVHASRRGAEKDQKDHRKTVHGGMSPPSGDRIGYAPPSSRGPLIVIGVFVLLILIRQLTGVAPDDVARWLGLI